MATARIELNHQGMAALLRSDEVQNLMERTADEAAQRARSRGVMVEGDSGQEVPVPIDVVRARSKRARALVSIHHPAGEAIESKYRLLGGALG